MKTLVTSLIITLSFLSFADEGMYLPTNLKKVYKTMKAAGLGLSHKQIFNPKKPSIKDAIVSLGGFCTAEIISPKGLMLTNHHCGYDAIRANSTPENDYLTDGFWAKDYSDEKPVEGLTASIVLRVDDVTKEFEKLGVNDLPEQARAGAIKQLSEKLVAEAEEGTHYNAYVKEFYEGSEFYLFVTEVFEDIRLVGAPPSAIGKFGGDTDNWMWDRHTGDFSLFRIYAGPDNKPAPFSMENKPYVPKYHLPISLKGIQEDDFTMIMGYPGSTDRYLTSYGVKMAVEKDQPARVRIRGKKLEIMKEDMDASDEVRLAYASTYAQVSNYWKYFIGQTEQLNKNGVYQQKLDIETSFTKWVNEKPARQERYGDVLKDISSAYETLTEINPTNVYFFEAIYSLGINKFIISHYRLKRGIMGGDKESVEDQKSKLALTYKGQFQSFFPETEGKLLAAMLDMYVKNVPEDQLTKSLVDYNEKCEGNWSKFVNDNFKKSVFTDKNRYAEFIENPTKSIIEDEPLLIIATDLLDKYLSVTNGPKAMTAQAKLDRSNRLFIEALRQMYPKKHFYPNANFTWRLTYGNVKKYTNKDGKTYDYYTTIEGIMKKEDPNNDEFIVPSKLKELYETKDYGRYGTDGTLWINFISTNDITGGNSGSPVMNSNGELIGCAFDGNWEAMSGDIDFEESMQRTISCDIRYVLFVIEKYGDAKHLVDEMTIVE